MQSECKTVQLHMPVCLRSSQLKQWLLEKLWFVYYLAIASQLSFCSPAFTQEQKVLELETMEKDFKRLSNGFESLLNLGLFHPSEKKTFKYTFPNVSKSKQKIVSLKPSCGCTTVEVVADVADAGEKFVIKFSYAAGSSSGPLSSTIQIVTIGDDGELNWICTVRGLIRDYIQTELGEAVTLKVDKRRLDAHLQPFTVFNYFSDVSTPPTIVDKGGLLEFKEIERLTVGLPPGATGGWRISPVLTESAKKVISNGDEQKIYSQTELLLRQLDDSAAEHSLNLHVWIELEQFVRSRVGRIELYAGTTKYFFDLFFLKEIRESEITMALKDHSTPVSFSIVKNGPRWWRVAVDFTNIDISADRPEQLVIIGPDNSVELSIPVIKAK
jgi:hypothetical protein